MSEQRRGRRSPSPPSPAASASPPATLRTWDRRYGLGPVRAPRRRAPALLARRPRPPAVMRRLTLEGVAPGEAARAALAAHATARARPPPSDDGGPGRLRRRRPWPPTPRPWSRPPAHFDNAAVRWMLARVHPRDPLAW